MVALVEMIRPEVSKGLPDIDPITMAELISAVAHPRVLVEDYLYADLKNRLGAGGISKTTLALYEMVRGALGRSIWGRMPAKPIRSVIVTREDNRQILVARLREIMRAEELTDDEIKTVLSRVAIVDLTGQSFRLCRVNFDVVESNRETIGSLMDILEPFGPDHVIFDPLVSFGVGEQRVNDAEQGLIEAFRVIRNHLDCCVEGIHHTGKANARAKTDDQYSGRGGSALADGCRMVSVINQVTPSEWVLATGSALEIGASGIVMALPKLSYCRPQQPIYIKRMGYHFQHVQSVLLSEEEQQSAIVEQVYRFIADEYKQGHLYSTTQLEAQSKQLDLNRKHIREATTVLKATGRVLYNEVKGKAGSHYQPVETNEPDLAEVGRGIEIGGEK